jgi:hypothetical protein
VLSSPSKEAKQFPPSVKKERVRDWRGAEVEIDVPDGIIAYLTRKCGGNVHDQYVVDVTSGSFEKVTIGSNLRSGALSNSSRWEAKHSVDLGADSCFLSAYRSDSKDIPHTQNNWLCYDFKERKIVPTHYTIRTNNGVAHLKSWVVETSKDRENWQEVDHKESTNSSTGRGLLVQLRLRAAESAASSG